MNAAGLKTGIYFSLIDWSDPRYRSIYQEGAKREDCLKDIYGSPAGGEEDYAFHSENCHSVSAPLLWICYAVERGF